MQNRVKYHAKVDVRLEQLGLNEAPLLNVVLQDANDFLDVTLSLSVQRRR
jgi:hypothetical protein